MTTEIKIEILTTESDEWKEVTVSVPSEDILGGRVFAITEAAILWCSDNGYSYDNWDYLSQDEDELVNEPQNDMSDYTNEFWQ